MGLRKAASEFVNLTGELLCIENFRVCRLAENCYRMPRARVNHQLTATTEQGSVRSDSRSSHRFWISLQLRLSRVAGQLLGGQAQIVSISNDHG